MTPTEIRKLAKKYQWEETICSETFTTIGFKKNSIKIHIFYGKRQEIETEIWHPKSKKYTSLVRPGLSSALLEAVFQNPRSHTNVGRYKTPNDITKKLKTSKLPQPR